MRPRALDKPSSSGLPLRITEDQITASGLWRRIGSQMTSPLANGSGYLYGSPSSDVLSLAVRFVRPSTGLPIVITKWLSLAMAASCRHPMAPLDLSWLDRTPRYRDAQSWNHGSSWIAFIHSSTESSSSIPIHSLPV
jgi:hypothetical protein